MKEKKEKLVSMNVTETLKGFIFSGKELLRERLGRFISEPNVLLYYLKQNNEFMEDYNRYCTTKGKVNDLVGEN